MLTNEVDELSAILTEKCVQIWSEAEVSELFSEEEQSEADQSRSGRVA